MHCDVLQSVVTRCTTTEYSDSYKHDENKGISAEASGRERESVWNVDVEKERVWNVEVKREGRLTEKIF